MHTGAGHYRLWRPASVGPDGAGLDRSRRSGVDGGARFSGNAGRPIGGRREARGGSGGWRWVERIRWPADCPGRAFGLRIALTSISARYHNEPQSPIGIARVGPQRGRLRPRG